MSRPEIGAKQCPMPSGNEGLNKLPFPFGSADEDHFGIGLDPLLRVRVEFPVQKAGVVTSALHEMEVGAVMGIRGFLGNSWPIDYLAGKNIVIVGGWFAFKTLRSLINYMIDERNRSRFGKITRKSKFLSNLPQLRP
jgi:NAD(P)H-flavin reductase